ncbi:MAG TPA: BON domain-containing protein [Limnochordia bacterium]|nr:BON domain-containing protein [Limnochordia bacterium]
MPRIDSPRFPTNHTARPSEQEHSRSSSGFNPGPQDPDTAISDPDLDFKVAYALKKAPELEPFVIKVRTTDGIVELSGRVKTDEQVRLATQTAMQVDGILGVHNKLRTKR